MGESKHSSILRETAYLSVFSVILQGMGLLLNIFLTRRLGAASVGALTLIGSFYSLTAVLSGGSGFIATSRFLSEELGCGGNPQRVFRYAGLFCLTLSSSFALVLCLFAPHFANLIAKTGANAVTIRLLSLSLPVSAWIACLKGRCYAYQKAILPAISECIEFLVRAGFMAFYTVFLIPYGKATILTAFAVSGLAGQGIVSVFLMMMPMPHQENCNICSFRFPKFIRLMMPIIGNACLVSLLSTANDALVPLTLLQFGSSTDQALAQFGEFEAIIIPVLFFPSVVQCCMSGLMVPELSRARAEQNGNQIRTMTERVLEQTVSFALFVTVFLVQFGEQLGILLGGEAYTGGILRLMAPVVPFIYIEIILEGVLRGLGKQNFSSLNYLAEYVVRISVLLICVPMFGFYGIVASYMACNLTGNAVRLFFVLRVTGLQPDWKQILLRPFILILVCWQITLLCLIPVRLFRLPAMVSILLFALICGTLYFFGLRVYDNISGQTKAAPGKAPQDLLN